MNFQNKTVFVSGGAGCIGRVLVAKLLEAGAKVFVGDLKPKPADWSNDILYRQGDLNDLQPWEIEGLNIDTFFHLAATFERSTETYEFWDENYRHNLQLSNHLMGVLRHHEPLKRVVFASSYLIYNSNTFIFDKPATEPVKLAEDYIIQPRNLCGAAKLMHETELDFLNHFEQTGFSSVSARIYRSYGRDTRDIISRWVTACLKGETLTLFNEEGMFDYVMADDVAMGLMKLAQSDITGIINLGRGNARRVSEVVEILQKHFPDVKIKREKADIGYEASQADMTKFKELIGWAPETDLEESIPQIIEFQKAKFSRKPAEVLQPFNVLISSVSRKISCINNTRQGLNKLVEGGKVWGGDNDATCLGRYSIDEFWEMPRLNDLTPQDFVDYCQDNNIRAVIPTRDGELSYFAENKEFFNENGIGVMVSPPQAIITCVDKLSFSEHLINAGFNAIPTYLDMADCLEEKIVVKERFGAGSQSILLGVNKAEIAAGDHTIPLQAIYQPYITGDEFSIDVYVSDKGIAKGAIVRKRDKIINGESQLTTAISNKELEELCCKMSVSIGLYGHSVWQAIKDENGKYWIIECNSRIGGASSLSIAMGLESYYWFLSEAIGRDITDLPFNRSTVNLQQLRAPHDTIAANLGL